MSLEGSGSTIEPHPHVALSAAPIVPQVSPMRAKLSQGIHESGRTRPSTRKPKAGIEPLSPRCLPSCAVETGNFDRNRCFLPHAERFAAASRFIAQEPSSRNACSKAHRDSVELRSGRGARGPATSARGRGRRRSRSAKMCPVRSTPSVWKGCLAAAKSSAPGETAYLPRYSLASFIARRPEFTAQAACEPGANLTS